MAEKIFCPIINDECKGETCIFWYREKLLEQEGCNLKFTLENLEAITVHLDEIEREMKKLRGVVRRDTEISHLEDISAQLTKLGRKVEEKGI